MKDPWLVRRGMFGRTRPTGWKGWAALLGVGLAFTTIKALHVKLVALGSPVLYWAVMVPIGLSALFGAWVVASRTKRE